VAAVLLPWAVAFVLFLFAGRAVGRLWILAVPLALGALFVVLLAVNGAGDTDALFLVVWSLITVASAEAGAWVGLGKHRDDRRDSSPGS
jgi:hypothetical protein